MTNGLLVMAGAAPVLRQWALELSKLGTRCFDGKDEVELDWPRNDGEVQILEDFRA